MESRVINTTTILDMLAAGKTRKEINIELDLSLADRRVVYNHPDIKNKRVSTPSTVSNIIMVGIDEENTMETKETTTVTGNLDQTPFEKGKITY